MSYAPEYYGGEAGSSTVDTSNIIYLVRGDSYDGTANARLDFTVTKDFQTGWTGVFTIRHRTTDAVLLSATAAATSSTSVLVTLDTDDTAFALLVSDDEFGPHPYDIQMVNSSSEITPVSGVAVIRKDRTTA